MRWQYIDSTLNQVGVRVVVVVVGRASNIGLKTSNGYIYSRSLSTLQPALGLSSAILSKYVMLVPPLAVELTNYGTPYPVGASRDGAP